MRDRWQTDNSTFAAMFGKMRCSAQEILKWPAADPVGFFPMGFFPLEPGLGGEIVY
jgi:hypothetical protein